MNSKTIDTQSLLCGAVMLLTTLSGSTLNAQTNAKDTTVNRTVVVEQQYNPNIMDAQKVNVLPEMREFTTTPNQVEYDRNTAPATVFQGTAMTPIVGEEKQQYAKQGYLRMGYGNVGNLDVEGNYLFNLSGKDKLNLSLGMQGVDGEVYGMLYGTQYDPAKSKWDARFYRTMMGLDYIHQFNTVDFNIGGHYGLSNFNYVNSILMDHQRFNSGDVRIGVKSTDRSIPMRFDLESGLYFYTRAHNFYVPDSEDSFSETSVRTKGALTGDITENQIIGVAFEMNNLFYNNDAFKNYTTLLLNPYYEMAEEEMWKVHLGMNADLAFGYGKKLRVSPDIKAEYTFSDSYVLYAHATGGRILNDFRRMEYLNRYGEMAKQNEDSYEQLHAALGFKMNPAAGLWFNIYGGYQIVKDDMFEGVSYESLINTPTSHTIFFVQEKTKNAYAGLQISYAYKDIFSFMTKGQLYNWKSDNEEALRFKPNYRFDFQTSIRPIPELSINVGYEFVRRCELDPGQFSLKERESNLSNLSAGVTYDLFNGVSIYARFSNLLNRKARYYVDSPVPGINFLGGMIFSF